MKKNNFFSKNVIIAVTVLAVLIVAVLGGAYYLRVRNKLSDEEAKAILDKLLPKSYELNEIIWGDGLPVDPNAQEKLESVTGAQYRPVDPTCGYSSTEQLKTLIAKVYSPTFIQTDINKIMFEGDEDVLAARYQDGENGLTVNIMNEGYDAVGKTRIDSSSVTVTGVDFSEVYVTVEDVYEDGSRQKRELTLVKTEDGWRLDTPTY